MLIIHKILGQLLKNLLILIKTTSYHLDNFNFRGMVKRIKLT